MQSDDDNVTVDSTAVPEPGTAVVDQMMEVEPDPTTLNLFAEDVKYVREQFSAHDVGNYFHLMLVAHGRILDGDSTLWYHLSVGHKDSHKVEGPNLKKLVAELIGRITFDKENAPLMLPKASPPAVDDDDPF